MSSTFLSEGIPASDTSTSCDGMEGEILTKTHGSEAWAAKDANRSRTNSRGVRSRRAFAAPYQGARKYLDAVPDRTLRTPQTGLFLAKARWRDRVCLPPAGRDGDSHHRRYLSALYRKWADSESGLQSHGNHGSRGRNLLGPFGLSLFLSAVSVAFDPAHQSSRRSFILRPAMPLVCHRSASAHDKRP